MDDTSRIDAAATTEAELKLTLPPRLAGRLMTHPLIERLATSAAKTERLIGVYYDSPKFELMARGVGLRLRSNSRGWIQTLKYGGPVHGGLHQRMEIETPVADQSLDPSVLATAGDHCPHVPAHVLRRLKPRFVTDYARTSRQLKLPSGGEAELSLDRGTIVAGAARAPICELELELKGGALAEAFDLIEALQAAFRLRPECRSKAERGYCLVGVKGGPVKACAVIIAPGANVPEAVRTIVSSALDQLQANEHGTLTVDDPEYLHQMRVAVRRLRAGLAACAPALPADPFDAIRAELKWLGARLGAARNWDVLLSESWPRLRDSYPAANDAAQFERAAAALHASARRQALAAVHSQRYALLVLRLARVATTAGWAAAVPETVPVSSFAKKLLDRRLKQVNNKGTRKRDASLDELHALRIAVKKLRYALEFFESLFPIERVKRLRGRLVALQDVLGEINDATTMRVMTTDALTRNRRFTNVVTGWTAHIIHDRREQHRECWRAFRRVRKFW